MAVRIIGHTTVREEDGLAFSSRNARLSSDQRALAPHLAQAMRDAMEDLVGGEPPDAVLAAAQARLRAKGFVPDYLALVEPDTLHPFLKTGVARPGCSLPPNWATCECWTTWQFGCRVERRSSGAVLLTTFLHPLRQRKDNAAANKSPHCRHQPVAHPPSGCPLPAV